MKVVFWFLGIFIFLLAALGVTERLAAERIEVVELHTLDTAGEQVVTRLWIVDHEGSPYLRAGDKGSGWYQRVIANGTIRVMRDDKLGSYRAIPDVSKRTIVNQLMRDKYTWGDQFISTLFGTRDGAIPIRLVAIEMDQG